jgi:hypothetical protein
MGKRERYEPGTFCWVDLMTTDADGAKSFYRNLFGWSFEDIKMPPGGIYTTVQLDRDAIGGLYEQPAEQRQEGVPPSWMNHVSVDDAGAVAEKAKELGGNVLVGPMEVMENGTTVVVQDPTGAVLGAWQPNEQIGAARVNDPGCLTSNELSTNDIDSATDFYSKLFGWKIEEIDTGGGPRYWLINHDGAAKGRNGGMRELAPEQQGVLPHWMPYFTVESADRAIEKAKAGGGALHAGPIDIPAGRIAVLGDPQGATFAIFEGDVDD